MSQPINPHPLGKKKINLTVTEEELFVLRTGVERVADLEDGEFAYIREVAGNLVLPSSIVGYANMRT
jgi:hypothetical protein